MNRIKILSLLISAIFLGTACTSMLEQEPTSVIGTDSFWKTEDDANAALNGIYDSFRSTMDYEFFNWSEMRGDIFTDGKAAPEGYEILYQNGLSEEDNGKAASWQGLYYTIHNCNLMIKYIDGIEFTEEADKSNMKAHAYAVRAFSYFIIARVWGDAPLRLEPTENLGDGVYLPRSPATEILDLVQSDITTARGLFSDGSDISNRYMFSTTALDVMEAELALHNGMALNIDKSANAAKALTLLENVESNSAVTPLSNYNSIFSTENKKNSEIILSIPFIDQEETGCVGDQYYLDAASMPGGASGVANDTLVGGGISRFTLKKEVCDYFDATDDRAYTTFLILYNLDSEEIDENITGIIGRKYAGHADETSGARVFDSDVIVYRWAEVILMKAEAYYAQGDYVAATNEIEKVRARVGLEYTGGVDQASVKRAIADEYLFEMAGEGKRWWRLNRLSEGAGDLFTKEIIEDIAPGKYIYETGRPYYFPLSLTTMSLNGELIQTAGY